MNLFIDDDPLDGICDLICQETLQCLRDSSVPMHAEDIIKRMARKNSSTYAEAEKFVAPLLRYAVEYGFLRQVGFSCYVYDFRAADKALSLNRKANEMGGVKSIAFNWLQTRQSRYVKANKTVSTSKTSGLTAEPKKIAKIKPLKVVRAPIY